ncbi:MAG: deoxyribose-phosphate aldolase [Thermoproteota archaeon]|nr:deoxyribose-phosphate aldolase [Candidatus Brockarchaeota archaeon]MBO3768133.1 deoxyribose-phosphate aldolase [Candidatus Brockarchaeota archaeon]MBO3801340.1 deoxyribose-phosphate aldolase [Candidatus Brockarchaeota archaeon]
MNWKSISKVIDAAILKPNTTAEEIQRFAYEAINDEYRSICVSPYFVSLAYSLLKNTNTKICTVVAFPFGYNALSTKLYEIKTAVEMGANEIDYVINLGAYFSYGDEAIAIEASKVVEEAKANGAEVVKAIIEVGYLNENQIIEVSKSCVSSGVDYIKTSTGYGPRPTKIEDIRLIKSAIGNKAGIKASGGIKTLDVLLSFLDAGANIIGTSSFYEIISEAKRRFS